MCCLSGEVISSFSSFAEVTMDKRYKIDSTFMLSLVIIINYNNINMYHYYRLISVSVGVTLFLPLSILRSIHSLRITSGFALFSILFVAFCVTLRGIQYLAEKGTTLRSDHVADADREYPQLWFTNL